jgi:hypothetical protein
MAPKKTHITICPAQAADMPAFARIHFSTMDDGLGTRMTTPPMSEDPAAQEGFAAWSAHELEGNPWARYWKASLWEVAAAIGGEAAADVVGQGKKEGEGEQKRSEGNVQQQEEDEGVPVAFAKWMVYADEREPAEVKTTFRMPVAGPTANQPAWDDLFGYIMDCRREFVGTKPFVCEFTSFSHLYGC